jgi:hypothetical protein
VRRPEQQEDGVQAGQAEQEDGPPRRTGGHADNRPALCHLAEVWKDLLILKIVL